MATTYFGSAIKQGVSPSEATAAVTSTVLSIYKTTLHAATAASVDATITLPKNSQIVAIYADSTVLWTATTASLTAGITAGGTEYVTGFDVKTITRGPTAAYTAAQLSALNNIGTNTSLVFRVASTGANNTGTTIVTVVVAQTE